MYRNSGILVLSESVLFCPNIPDRGSDVLRRLNYREENLAQITDDRIVEELLTSMGYTLSLWLETGAQWEGSRKSHS
jgi:hypothetical protein